MKKILIDLDGVLNEYGNSGYNANYIPKPKRGVNKFLRNLSNKAELYLFTSRDKSLATKWLHENKLKKYFKAVTNMKIPASMYIDDRAICFEGDFDILLNQIENFQVYWKRL